MRIKINYSGVDINPYFVEIERTAEQTPITLEDFAKLALQESKFEQIKSIESCLIKEHSAEAIVLTVTLSNRSDLLSILPRELLTNIFNEISSDSYQIFFDTYHVFTKATSSLLNRKTSNVKPVSVSNIFEQHPAEWLLTKPSQKLINTTSMLEKPEKITELLTLMNGWIQTDKGSDYIYIWMDLCRDDFITLYNSLAKPQSAELTALFALITPDVEALDLIQLNAAIKKITKAFPHVAASLNFTEQSLKYVRNLSSEDDLKILHKTKTFQYWNAQKINLKFKNISKLDFEYGNFEGADLEAAAASSAVFRNANMQNTNLKDTQLSYTDCRNTKFNGSTMKFAKIESSNLNNADLCGVIDIDRCFFNNRTIFANVNFADTVIIQTSRFDPLDLTSAKETTFKYLEQKIKQATSQTLLVIYEKNKQGILFLKSEIDSDYGILFNEAILNQAKFLLSKAPNEGLQNLIAKLESTLSPVMHTRPGIR